MCQNKEDRTRSIRLEHPRAADPRAIYFSYLATCVDIALLSSASVLELNQHITHLPLGSVCSDHVGFQRITVDAQYGGKCSSNINRYR